MKSSKRELRIALSSHRLRTVKGKGTMKEDREQTKLDFLEYAVTHLENRIGLLDKIASILIAIQTGFFVLVAFVLKYVLGGDTLYFQVVGYTFLLGLVLILNIFVSEVRRTKNGTVQIAQNLLDHLRYCRDSRDGHLCSEFDKPSRLFLRRLV
jgi:hypothetical protein